MANSILCTKCGHWVHRRCSKMRKLLYDLTQSFVCARCSSMTARIVTMEEEKLCDGIETVKSFRYLGDRFNTSGGSEAAVTARTKIGWVKFKCGEMLYGKRFSLKLKGKVQYIRVVFN